MPDRLNVLIDGFNLGLETGTGVATYARNLTYCINRLGHEVGVLYDLRAASDRNRTLREIAFFDPSGQAAFSRLDLLLQYLQEALFWPLGAPAVQVPITGKVISKHFRARLPYFDSIWNSPDIFGRATRQFAVSQYFWPHRTRVRALGRVDIAHWTYPLPIYAPGTKNIYTLHDLVPLRLPFTTLDVKKYYFNLMKMLVRKADHIVTVSETSRQDIINLLGIAPEKVTNTYQSVEIPSKFTDKPDEIIKVEVEGALNVKYKEYVLFFGAIEPKKNVGRLIEAYLAANIDAPLVIVGKKAWKSEGELRMVNDDATSYLETLGQLTYRRHRILQVDYAPFSLLVSLIRGAKFVVFPSLYEGFGLPALEAMKLGTPVLTSTEGAMPEVAAEGAMLIDPYDTRALANGIIALDTDAELRASFSAKGTKRAEYFSPEAHSQRLSEVYNRVLPGSRSSSNVA